MKSHTPGPWLVRFDEDQFDPTHSTLKIIDGRDESVNHTHGALSLAFINVSAFAPHMDEPLANARLIASAPEMLEALALIYANAGESPEWIRARIAPVIEKAIGGSL
jgi:hypothetical protein